MIIFDNLIKIRQQSVSIRNNNNRKLIHRMNQISKIPNADKK